MESTRGDVPSVEAGLSADDAARRLAADGPNALPPPARRARWRQLGAELVHFFALMLWVASVLAVVAGMPALGIAIAGVVVVNAVFAFVQEHRADQAAERLQGMLPTRVTVRRDGRPVAIDADRVVVGDVLLLDEGDRVPADATVIESHDARIDASMLTGESDTVGVDAGGEVLAGTFVVEGSAVAVVQATGGATRLAHIAALTTLSPKPDTPLTRGLHEVVRTIAVIAVGVGAGFFVVSVVLGNAVSDGFVFAIGVTVALVPEALLPTVTLSLAWGAERMAERQVLVRHLEAVETLGSTTFICTDKTGTLTMNEMTVREVWSPRATATVEAVGYQPRATVAVVGDRPWIERLALVGARCSTGYVQRDDGTWRAHGDPTEAALDAFARRCGWDTDRDRLERPEVTRFAFDHRRRRMSTVVDGEVLVKGAPDAVLPRCSAGVVGADEAMVSMGRRGLCVLAVARRSVGDRTPVDADEAESGLELLGLVGMEDPPRPDAREAVAACRRAHVKLAMITGDHPDTALAIAEEVGLSASPPTVVMGAELPADDAELVALLERDGVVVARVSPEDKVRIAIALRTHGHVVARVSPEDKVRIAIALRTHGHVVAMTGDGVNDAPALHEANIGVAMGLSGTDVAREAADLVLLDDRFASIVGGIEMGRATYVNMRRFLTYHLTDNVAELTPFVVWVLSGGRFPLALGVLQILALDIGTDTLSAVALGAERPGAHLLDGPPVSGKLMNRTVLRRAFGLLGPTVAAMSMLSFVVSMWALGWRPGGAWPEGHELASASGATFMAIVLAQTANAWACRSTSRRPDQIGWTTNRLLIATASIELAFALTVVFVGPLADLLDHASPPLWGWVVALASIPVVFAVDALDKARRRRRVT